MVEEDAQQISNCGEPLVLYLSFTVEIQREETANAADILVHIQSTQQPAAYYLLVVLAVHAGPVHLLGTNEYRDIPRGYKDSKKKRPFGRQDALQKQ